MGAFQGQSRSMGGLYTFYQRLKENPYYGNIGQVVEQSAKKIESSAKSQSLSIDYLTNMAKAELKNEEALLSKIFGVNIQLDEYSTQGDYKLILDTLNEFLNIKEVYERNIQLIKNTKGKKSVISFYPTYFMHAWEAAWPSIASSCINGWDSGAIGDELAAVIRARLPSICEDGIRRMLDGPEVEANAIDDNLKYAYKDLLNHMGNVGQKGSLADQIYKLYNIEAIADGIIGQLKGSTLEEHKSDLSKKAHEITHSSLHSRGGFTLEAIENTIFSMIAGGITGGHSAHTGQTKMKADNIVSFNIDSGLLEKAFEQAGADREKNIAALSELGRKLQGIQDGFIVYSSDKNYSLNANFKGFSAGSLGKTVQSFINNVYRNDIASGNTLLGAIMQLGEGAILEGMNSTFEAMIAQEVAYMLFDDFTTIGISQSDGKAIHIMNLNGVMVPLSALLSLLAKAITMLEAEQIVQVSIKAPPIMFSSDGEQKAWQEKNNAKAIDAWNAQRAYALANTTINTKILKNFKDLISMIL